LFLLALPVAVPVWIVQRKRYPYADFEDALEATFRTLLGVWLVVVFGVVPATGRAWPGHVRGVGGGRQLI